MALTDQVVIHIDEAAEYVGIAEPTAGQRIALARLCRSAVEHVGLYLNRDFAGEAVPAAVEQACVRMMASLYEGEPKKGSGAAAQRRRVKRESVGRASVEYEVETATRSGLPPDVERLVSSYRRPPGI